PGQGAEGGFVEAGAAGRGAAAGDVSLHLPPAGDRDQGPGGEAAAADGEPGISGDGEDGPVLRVWGDVRREVPGDQRGDRRGQGELHRGDRGADGRVQRRGLHDEHRGDVPPKGGGGG